MSCIPKTAIRLVDAGQRHGPDLSNGQITKFS